MTQAAYIHGTDSAEQERLALLNRLTNPPFIEFLRLQATDSVLEVGSGLGILAREVAQRVPLGGVVGVECSAEQLARAESGLPNLRFAHGDAHHLPFADDRFDEEIEQAVAELRAFMERPDASALFYWNRAFGIK